MTDDEREYDHEMAVMLSHLSDEPMWSCVVIAKKLHAAGFRRSGVPEPSDEQVSDALLGYFPEVKDQKELQKWGKRTRERMRAALRAAYEARGEGR